MINTSRQITLRLAVRNELVKIVQKEMIGDRRNLSMYKYSIILICNDLKYFFYKLLIYIIGNKGDIYTLEEAHMKTQTPNVGSILNFLMVRRLS